jgi:hypothetical protein
MRNGQVSLRERDGSQADLPLAEAVSCLQARARLAEHARGRHVIKPASGPLRAMDPGLPSIRAVPTAGSVCPLLAPFRRGGAVE